VPAHDERRGARGEVVAERGADDGDGPPLEGAHPAERERRLRPPPRPGVGDRGEQTALRPALGELAQDPGRRRAQVVVVQRAQQAVAIPALAQLGDPRLGEEATQDPHARGPGVRTAKPCAPAASARRSSYV